MPRFARYCECMTDLPVERPRLGTLRRQRRNRPLVRPTRRRRELELTADALGMVYLGGHRCERLAESRIGERLEQKPSLGPIRSLPWHPAPWCPE